MREECVDTRLRDQLPQPLCDRLLTHRAAIAIAIAIAVRSAGVNVLGDGIDHDANVAREHGRRRRTVGKQRGVGDIECVRRRVRRQRGGQHLFAREALVRPLEVLRGQIAALGHDLERGDAVLRGGGGKVSVQFGDFGLFRRLVHVQVERVASAEAKCPMQSTNRGKSEGDENSQCF